MVNKDDRELLVGSERRKENIMIPYSMVGLVAAIIFQTMGAIWWASGVSVKLDYLQKTQTEFAQTVVENTKNRYTSIDSARDMLVIDKRISKVEEDVEKLKEKLREE